MRFSLVNAGIAQLVEQLICNQQVVGSNPSAGSSLLSDGNGWLQEIENQENDQHDCRYRGQQDALSGS
jgi:hypothetical protein